MKNKKVIGAIVAVVIVAVIIVAVVLGSGKKDGAGSADAGKNNSTTVENVTNADGSESNDGSMLQVIDGDADQDTNVIDVSDLFEDETTKKGDKKDDDKKETTSNKSEVTEKGDDQSNEWGKLY